MVYTIDVKENTVRGKQLIDELYSEKEIVTIENPAITGRIPEGYLSMEEFCNRSTVMIKKMFENYG